MGPEIRRIEFEGASGHRLAARLDSPSGSPRAYALFAHCFTCSKDIHAASRISRGLAERGIAVLRFDFTGLGSSEGEFANTNFSSNVGDLAAAAAFLRRSLQAPQILIGHSLGGAAVLAAAEQIPEVRAVCTIGAPADPSHVRRLFTRSAEQIAEQGEAEVAIGGRSFRIQQQFLEDLEEQNLSPRIRALGKALLVFHSPTDTVVGIDNARRLYEAAQFSDSGSRPQIQIGGAQTFQDFSQIRRSEFLVVQSTQGRELTRAKGTAQRRHHGFLVPLECF